MNGVEITVIVSIFLMMFGPRIFLLTLGRRCRTCRRGWMRWDSSCQLIGEWTVKDGVAMPDSSSHWSCRKCGAHWSLSSVHGWKLHEHSQTNRSI